MVLKADHEGALGLKWSCSSLQPCDVENNLVPKGGTYKDGNDGAKFK